MKLTIATGGVSYRMQRDERSVGSLIELAMFCGRSSQYEYAGHQAYHSSNIWTGRAVWLRELIADVSIDIAVSVDSDTTFRPIQLLVELERMNSLDNAIGLCPVRVGGTDECNLAFEHPTSGVRRIRLSGLQELLKSGQREIHSGGFGVAVFNLHWYREHWPLPAPERIEFGMGEDTEHCLAVRKRGGKVIALAVPTDHFAWGEKQTR